MGAILAIAEARNANGVHYYFQVPHEKRNHKLRSITSNLQKSNTAFLDWTVVLFLKGSSADYGLRILNQNSSAAIEVGAEKDGSVYVKHMENKNWHDKKVLYTQSTREGLCMVFTVRLLYPEAGTAIEPVKVEVNGKHYNKTVHLLSKASIETMGYYFEQDKYRFDKVNLVEMHYQYWGITDSLPDKIGTVDYFSLKEATLAAMRVGDVAIVVGQYLQDAPKTNGFVLGAGTKKKKVLKTFTVPRSNDAYVFRISVGSKNVAISSEKEDSVQTIDINHEEDVWLLLGNVNISNIEITAVAM